MKRTTVIAFAAMALMAITTTLAGCASTGSMAEAQLDPADADAVVAVKGMSCPQCSYNIALLMDGVDEIEQSRIDLGEGQVFIAFVPEATLSSDQIIDLIDRAGFTAGEVTYLKQEAE